MDDETAAGQLETLARLLEHEGWGAQYLEAIKVGLDAIEERR